MDTLDLLVVGGTLAGVSAALHARDRGCTVALVTHRSYLGDDLCDPLRLCLPEDLDAGLPLAKRLFGAAVREKRLLRPMELKHELDQVLAEADIPVLLCAAPVRFAAGEEDRTLTLQTRSGTRDLSARRVIDATLRGELARLCGHPLTAPTPSVRVTRRVIGGEAEPGSDWELEGRIDWNQDGSSSNEPLWALSQTRPLADGSWGAWMELEQKVRLTAYRPGQLQSADGIEASTGEHLHPGRPVTDASGDLHRIPAGAILTPDSRLACCGNIVAVDSSTLAHLSRPDVALTWGQHAAQLLLETPTDETRPEPADPPEMTVDVLVIGGGTGGAPAAIGAARGGARTLVAEVLSGLGGVGTLGLIGRYWFGNRVGFTAEVDVGCAARTTRDVEKGWDIEAKMQWYHEQVDRAGGHVWYKTALAKVLTEDSRVCGALLATPQGAIRIHANCVVDATGSGEVAARAGAETVAIGQGRLALQGTGLPGRNPGQNYHNTDYDFIDDSDDADTQSAHITARGKFKNAFDAGQHIDSRERRRVVGDIEISPMDIRLGRIFPDTIVKARSNFDTHGYTIHPLFMIVPPDHDPIEAHIPLRALLPKGLDGVLVTGLGISAHRDAMPVIRMQADVQNQGYAAGYIAAHARDGRVRNIDLDALQAHLVEAGILEAQLRGAPDSFPLPDSEIDAALQSAPDVPDRIDRVFTLPDAERDARLRRAYHQATDEKSRRFYAFALGILSDPSGLETLVQEVAETAWDAGWNYTGMGQFGESMSALDSRIIALGRCRDPRAVPVLADKADSLPEDPAFSHIRALAEAFSTLNTLDCIPPLERLLSRPGITGHSIHTQAERNATITDNACETSFRNRALIELHLATALHRLDPEHSAARDILRRYARDLRGLFARHAREVLNG
ncbi:MAG: FAD-dependent oxidoreductase [Opitutales bacterium]